MSEAISQYHVTERPQKSIKQIMED